MIRYTLLSLFLMVSATAFSQACPDLGSVNIMAINPGDSLVTAGDTITIKYSNNVLDISRPGHVGFTLTLKVAAEIYISKDSNQRCLYIVYNDFEKKKRTMRYYTFDELFRRKK